MTAKKRVRWTPGAVHAVPLADGSFGIAQVVDAMMVNVLYVALFGVRVPSVPAAPPPLQRGGIVSLAATWRQNVERGEWPPIGTAAVVVPKATFPNERFAETGYVGAKHYDAGLLADFLSAYHGLLPWNALHEENYYDQLLAPGVTRPASAVVLDTADRAAYRTREAASDVPVT